MTPRSAPPEPDNEMKPRKPWTRIIAWVAAGLGLLILLLGVGVVALLQNSHFHQYLLRKTDQIASAQLGTRVTLQNFSIHIAELGVDLYGLTIDGAEPQLHSTLVTGATY